MATIDELHAQGHTRLRLPWWNEHAYAEVYEDPATKALGPWVKVYDVLAGVGSGEPKAVAIWECDTHNEWEPAPSPSGDVQGGNS